MKNELLIGIGGLVLAVLTYFAGVWRTKARHKKEDKGERINRVLDDYRKLVTNAKSSGLHGLVLSGVATLKTDSEIRELGKLISAHGLPDPLVAEQGILNEVNLKKLFDYAASRKINFLNVNVIDIIEKSKA